MLGIIDDLRVMYSLQESWIYWCVPVIPTLRQLRTFVKHRRVAMLLKRTIMSQKIKGKG